MPYNLYLSRKFDAYINIEVYALVYAVKYIHKYIYKGIDRIIIRVDGRENI